MRRLIVMSAGLMLACTDRTGTDDSDTSDTGTSWTSPNGLDDPLDSVPTYAGECDTVEYQGCSSTNLEAGHIYSVGDYLFEGDTFTGKEYIVVQPNAAWQDSATDFYQQPDDCVITFDVSGSLAEDPATGVKWEMSVTGYVVASETTCERLPGALDDPIDDMGQDFSGVTYRVRDLGNGGSEFRFHPSGTVFGTGGLSADGATYVAEPECQLYGTGTCR